VEKLCVECESLRAENDRLIALLEQHGISWQLPQSQTACRETVPPRPQGKALQILASAEKVRLFRNLFRGRTDIYPLRWTSAKGNSGYSPVCSNEWKPDVCYKPKVKCGDCNKRLLLPVTDQVIFDHLAGKHTVGVYPLLIDDNCYFLAVDFDDGDWHEDALAFMKSCHELNIPAALEISRSGKGAHVWIFFSESVPACEARQLGTALIGYTCERTRQLSLSSYDRLFPNQDTLPKGGFGNLIALPLQKLPRQQGFSVFVDENFIPYPDQWSFLASIQSLSKKELEDKIQQMNKDRLQPDVAFAEGEDESPPWKRPTGNPDLISGLLPESLTLVLANQIFFAKADLPQPLANRLIRLAAFQNPEFYKAQAMRRPVWNIPRIIGCAENFPQHIGLPRGCLDDVLSLLGTNNIRAEILDERIKGNKISVKFVGVLRKDQKTAVKAMMIQEIGVLCAPTAFGKTVTAAAMISKRKVNTLILVHRTELLRQWQERLTSFLDLPKDGLGIISGAKKKPSGVIDIAVMQSLSRREDLAELLNGYGQIIVDECHHLSAFSFETILKQAKVRYIIGLTATPIRRDGHHPIIFMQCGPIRHSAARPDTTPEQQEVWPQKIPVPEIPPDSSIQEVFRILSNDVRRTHIIAQDILNAYRSGRKILVLTERTEHLEFLREALGNEIEHCFVLHGRLSKKHRAVILSQLSELDDSAPRVLLATGRLIGEGFDYPPLDTLVLAMPISWKGTLQQYAGRLHREHVGKQDVRIYDYIENDYPQLARMWYKRLRGYQAMGCQIRPENL